MKKLFILFTLVFVLTMALSITSICFAESEPLPIAQEDGEIVVEQAQEQETADNNALVWLKETWEKCKGWLIGAFSGVSLSLVVGAIMSVLIKRATNKGFDRLEKNTNSQAIADLSSEKILNKLSQTALDVNIVPVMTSQYKALSEEINAELVVEIQKQDKKNLAIIKCFEAFADYFKCSTAVSDEQKQALADTIAEAKDLYSNCDNKVTAKIEVVAEAPTPKKSEKKVVENY